MAQVSDRVMFEIYREAGLNEKFRVVYYTELHDHNKEYEISRALSGTHVYEGFYGNAKIEDAKREINKILERMNDGEEIDNETIDEILTPFKPVET